MDSDEIQLSYSVLISFLLLMKLNQFMMMNLYAHADNDEIIP